MFCRTLAFLLFFLALGPAARTATVPGASDRYFTTSDQVRLHYLESGPRFAPTIVLVPGWTMPAWIFAPQIRAFSGRYHVIAFDPRGQGASDIPGGGYDQNRRGQDIAELIDQLGRNRIVILGWSLGVLDTLAYIHNSGDARIAGVIFIDNSVGENPPPVPVPTPRTHRRPLSHDAYMHAFVVSMFHTPQSAAYINTLTAATLRLPDFYARALLAYPVPRSYWRDAIFSTNVPVLYVVRPHLAGQAKNLLADRPNTKIAIFPYAGHALFVDESQKFDTLMAQFLDKDVWPP